MSMSPISNGAPIMQTTALTAPTNSMNAVQSAATTPIQAQSSSSPQFNMNDMIQNLLSSFMMILQSLVQLLPALLGNLGGGANNSANAGGAGGAAQQANAGGAGGANNVANAGGAGGAGQQQAVSGGANNVANAGGAGGANNVANAGGAGGAGTVAPANQSSQPSYAQPTYTQPNQPSYEQPQPVAYPQPTQPSYEQPQPVAYPQPTQPSYKQPAYPTHDCPKPEEPPVNYDTTYNGDGGKHWGDPHFVGDDGGKYDVMGQPGQVYNMISDKNFQYNAEFGEWKDQEDATVVTRAGLTIGNDQVEVTPSGAPIINGKVMKGNEQKLADGSVVKYDKEAKTVSITSSEYQLDFEQKSGGDGYLNGSYKTIGNPFEDGVAAHGLWGQTVDADKKARNGDEGKGAQGGGAIDTLNKNGDAVTSKKGDKEAIQYYVMGDLFSTQSVNADGMAFVRFDAARGTGLEVQQ